MKNIQAQKLYWQFANNKQMICKNIFLSKIHIAVNKPDF